MTGTSLCRACRSRLGSYWIEGLQGDICQIGNCPWHSQCEVSMIHRLEPSCPSTAGTILMLFELDLFEVVQNFDDQLSKLQVVAFPSFVEILEMNGASNFKVKHLERHP